MKPKQLICDQRDDSLGNVDNDIAGAWEETN